MEPLNSSERNRSLIRFALIQGCFFVLLGLLFFIGFSYPDKVKQEQIDKMDELYTFRQQLFIITQLVKELSPKVDSLATSNNSLTRSKLEAALDSKIDNEISRLPKFDKESPVADFLTGLKELLSQAKIVAINYAKLNADQGDMVTRAAHESAILDYKGQIQKLDEANSKLELQLMQCE
jgi:hypothetical protein